MAFTEQWLADYQARMAGLKDARPLPDVIHFTIPMKLILPNRLNGKSWGPFYGQRKRLKTLLDAEIGRWSGHAPMERARVTVTRFGSGREPDPDNLNASIKPLLDMLLVKRFGLIRDDASKHMVPIAAFVRVAHKPQERTEVLIERL